MECIGAFFGEFSFVCFYILIFFPYCFLYQVFIGLDFPTLPSYNYVLMLLNLYILSSTVLGVCRLACSANNTTENWGSFIVFSDCPLKQTIFQERKKLSKSKIQNEHKSYKMVSSYSEEK